MSRLDERLTALRNRDPRPRCGPEHVVIDLTNRCNNNCLACWTRSPLLRDRGPAPEWFSHELPRDVARHLLADLADLGCEIVRFTGGGEPLLHPAFAELVQETTRRGMRCAVTTNGTLLDRLDPPTLQSIDELTVSLWAGSPETYSRLHPNRTARTFHRVVSALERLRDDAARGQRRPELVLANVIGMMNYRELAAMMDLACRVGASRVYFTLVDPVPSCTDGLLLSHEAAATLLDQATQLFDAYGGQVTVDNEEGFLRRLHNNDPHDGSYDRGAVDEVPCLVGWFFARVLADGNVVPCCRAVGRSMGNLHDSRFPEVWNADRWVEVRRHADEPPSSTPFYRGIGCDTSCDNLMHNLLWQRIAEGRIHEPSDFTVEGGV